VRLVLIHIGSEIPEHFWVCLNQARKYFWGDINVVVPSEHICDDRFLKPNIHVLPWEDLANDTIYKEFKDACFLKGFWNVTMGRLFLLEILMRKYDLKEIIHIENDVLIYEDPNNMTEAFRKQASNSVAMTPIGDGYIAAAYCYIPHIEAISKLNTIMKSLLIIGEEQLKRRTSGEMINEMTLLAYIHKAYCGVIKHLPIRPIGKGAPGITPFNSVFDPASIGQHLDGTPSTPGVPMYDTDRHWLAPDLKSGKYKIEFIDGIPWMVAASKRYRINSLHIHSKRLERFV